MNKLKFYCEKCPYIRKDENEKYCARLNCCLEDCKEQIKNMFTTYSKKARKTIEVGNKAWLNKHEQEIADAVIHNFIIELLKNLED